MAIINDRINDVSTMNRAQFEECQYPRSASIGFVGGWDTQQSPPVRFNKVPLDRGAHSTCGRTEIRRRW